MDVKVPSDWDVVKPEKEELENMNEDEIEIINGNIALPNCQY